MGNEETKAKLPSNSNFHILDYGYCKVWKRKEDGKEIMEEYPVYHESEERLKLFESVWELRKNHSLFVSVYHFQHEESGTSCSTSVKGSLFTERIQYRLSEFGNIKYPEIVKIMRTCIEGYKELYEYFGAFVVRSTMVGFTNDFQMKLWIHTDLSQPEPENPNCNRVQEMFVSLITAVESTCEQLYYNCPRFSEFIVKTNYVYFSKDFDTLLDGLDDYVRQLDIRVPEDLDNLKFCFKKPEGWELFKMKNSYPKLIGSEAEIPEEISSVHESLTEKNMDKKTLSKRRIEFESSKTSLSFPTNYTNLETSNRILLSNSAPDLYNLQPLSHNQPSFTQNNKLFLNSEVQQNSSNQNSRVLYRFVKIKQKNSQNVPNFHSVHRFKTELLQQQKSFQNIKFEAPLNKFGDDFYSNLKENSPKKEFQTKIENYPKKSSVVTTETKNRGMSFEPELSLVQVFETQTKKDNFQRLDYK